MAPTPGPSQRLAEARRLVREKGLSKQDLGLLQEILKQGGSAVSLEEEQGPSKALLLRHFGVFLAFLDRLQPLRLGGARPAMGHVLQHGLARLARLARAAHREVLEDHAEPAWVVELLDLLASVRAMGIALDTEVGAHLQEQWRIFIQDHRDRFREVFSALQATGSNQILQLNQHLKALNRAAQADPDRFAASLKAFGDALEASVPDEARQRVAPLLLLEHVASNLRLSLLRPLDRGIHWPAVEQVRGSLQWLWDHTGWAMPRLQERVLRTALPGELRERLKRLRASDRPTFLSVARALASHLAIMDLLEHLPALVTASLEERYLAVPTFSMVDVELGRLLELGAHPDGIFPISPEDPLGLRVRDFQRQAALGIQQDRTTLQDMVQQALAQEDPELLAQTLDTLRGLLINHQRQLLGDAVGLFSPELRQRLFPDAPSTLEEGDRLRQRLQQLFERLLPLQSQLQLHLELADWPRLALGLAQVQQPIQAFRRSAEFSAMRKVDREEAEAIIQGFNRLLDNPQDVPAALREGVELMAEFLRFLELFLLRINARVPLIRFDLDQARTARSLVREIRGTSAESEVTRLSHRLIQTAKALGFRDPQTVVLLKRWVRAERNQKGAASELEELESHLERLTARLEGALG